LFDIFITIRLARNASNKLNGIANGSIPSGKTSIFAITSHINTNPTNHEMSVVCNNENFFAIINMVIAKHNDHNPQMAPFTGSDGKTKPMLSKWLTQYDFNKNSFLTNSDILIQIVANNMGKIDFFEKFIFYLIE
jgi:hypothetical protein